MICPKCNLREMHTGAKTAAGKIRWTCRASTGDRAVCYQTTDPTAAYRGRNAPKERDLQTVFPSALKRQTLVITWAQNATPIHQGFFGALQAYCKHNDAQLMVIPGRYKNPTSQWEASQVNAQWWASELVPFLASTRLAINKNLVMLADIHTQPTATTPLTGFEAITHGESGILGHPKLQMTVVPAPSHKTPKILTTTGAITVENYSDTKAGKKGEFHHVYGAIIVELEGAYFHLRHINAREDGAFVDLDKGYYPNGDVLLAEPYAGLVFGDTHVRFTNPTVDNATFGKGGLVEKLNPQTLVFHDLLDSYAVNPHHANKPFIAVAKQKAGYDNIQDEVMEACKWLIKRAASRQTRASVIDPFQYWAKRYFEEDKHIQCVGRRESLVIGGIECSLHGDQGSNGSRGSRVNLSKIGVKTIIGHSHSPGITNGAYQTGTSTPLNLEYTGAVSSWLHSHVAINAFGKRVIFNMVNGKFWR